MKNIVGKPVYGKDFMFRGNNVQKAIRLMDNSNSFLVLGIRRTGKSSFLKEVAHQISKKNKKYTCIELDCQTYRNALEFYKGLFDALPKPLKIRFKKLLEDSKRIPKKLIDFFTDVLESVQVFGTKVDFRNELMTYSKPLEELLNDFFSSTENVFLFIDELPFLFENMNKNNDPRAIQEIAHILTSMRSWRHGGLAIGITGSLNLHQQLEHLGVSRKLLAGLNTIKLSPFTHQESKSLIQQLLEDENHLWWTDEITEGLLAFLPDYIPYFLQYAFNEIAVAACKNKAEVEAVYHNNIMPGLFTDFIYQFDERLGIFKGEDLERAMLILDCLVQQEQVSLNDLKSKINSKFQYNILVKLIDYEFITLSGIQNYRFTLNIIKDWWRLKRNIK